MLFDLPATALITALLMLLSGLFSASETALTLTSKARMLTLEREGRRRAALINRMWKDRDLVISAILVGNNITNIAASAIMTGLLIQLFGDIGVAYATAGMTAFIVIFVEIFPKTIALRRPDDAAMFLAPFVRVMMFVLVPVTHVCRFIVHLALAPVPVVREDQKTAEEELRGMIDMHARLLDKERQAAGMLHAIVDLSDMTVSDVMLHRRDMKSLSFSQPSEKMVHDLLSSRHSLVPLWGSSPEDIVGVIDVRQLLAEMTRKEGDFSRIELSSVVTTPWFIPDSTGLLEQLKAFRKRRLNLAFVVDEYGVLQGMITLADILEEIVGHYDRGQYDALSVPKPQPDGAIIIDGRFPVREFNRETGWDLPDGHASTMAGLVIHVAGHIPEPGEQISFGRFFFEVLARRRNRVARLRIGRRRAEAMAV